jgi:hypothetical protein
MTYRCEACGRTHEGLPDLGFRWPDAYFDVPESERSVRVKGNSDTCAIDDEASYIRGVILMPLVGVTPCDHSLYLDYSQGVTLERAWSIAHARKPSGVA